jgi:hypothetical protein
MANTDRVARLSFEYVCEPSTNGTDVIQTTHPQVSHLVLKLSIFASIHHVKQSLLQFRLPSSMKWTEQNAVSLTGCPASLPLAQMQGVGVCSGNPAGSAAGDAEGHCPSLHCDCTE